MANNVMPANYPKLIKETGRNPVYEYDPTKGYTWIPDMPTFRNKGYNFADVQEYGTPEFFGQQAGGELSALYAPLEEQNKNYYNTLREQFGQQVKGEFQRRGILESGLYGQEFAEGTADIAGREGTSAAQLNLQKEGAIRGRVSENLSRRYAEEAEARRKYEWEQEQALRREELAYNREQMAAAAKKGYSSGGGGGGGGGSSLSKTAQARNELMQDASGLLADWVRRGKPAWETENKIAPALMQAYPEFSKDQIFAVIYQMRKMPEYGGE